MAQATDTIELPSGGDPRAEFTMWKGGELRIDCTSDWCGDTESGFGATVGVTLSNEHAKELLAFLQQHLK